MNQRNSNHVLLKDQQKSSFIFLFSKDTKLLNEQSRDYRQRLKVPYNEIN